MDLVRCHSCEGFVVDLSAPCPHCAATTSRVRPLRRAWMVSLLGATSAVTLMACYGDIHIAEPCLDDRDCGLGEICDVEFSDTCQWTDLCDPWQCPNGYVCDVSRRTCVEGTGCLSDLDCGGGTRCIDGACAPSIPCSWAEPTCGVGAICDGGPAGDEFDDGWCVPCEGDACGSCAIGPLPGDYQGALPSCGDDVPGVADGRFLGSCIPADQCPSPCDSLDEETCLSTAVCQPRYDGVGCTAPDGGPCVAGQPCTCAGYEFGACEPLPAPTPRP